MILRGQNDISRWNNLHGWRFFFLIRTLNDLLKGIIPEGGVTLSRVREISGIHLMRRHTYCFLSESCPHAQSYIWKTCSSNLRSFLIIQKCIHSLFLCLSLASIIMQKDMALFHHSSIFLFGVAAKIYSKPTMKFSFKLQ